jgi:multiple sugar transport system permease protein
MECRMARIRKKLRFPLIMITPSLVIISFIVIFPLLFSLYASLTPYYLLKPNTLFNFVGLRNYANLFKDVYFWQAFGRTILFLGVVINLELFIGLAIALLLQRIAKGSRIIRTLVMIPMMFAPVLVGFQFKFMFNDNIGLVNNFLQLFGVQKVIPWLIDKRLALLSLMGAEIWTSTPLMTIILLAGLLSLPNDPFEAAKVDGASNVQMFRFITWPLLAPFIYIALAIRSLDVARAYDIVRIMTGGGPARRTEVLWTYIYRKGIVDARFGVASAMSYIAIIISILFTYYFFRQLIKTRIVQ